MMAVPYGLPFSNSFFERYVLANKVPSTGNGFKLNCLIKAFTSGNRDFLIVQERAQRFAIAKPGAGLGVDGVCLHHAAATDGSGKDSLIEKKHHHKT